MFEIRTDYEKMYSNIMKTVRGYLTSNKSLRSLVLGISGGIDSAMTCALAHEAVKDAPGVKVIGRSIPIETNTDEEMERAERVGRSFCDDFKTKELTIVYQGLYQDLMRGSDRPGDDSEAEKIRRGNFKARVRMCYLFDLAHYENGMVLSTDNYTELLLGFWTLHGDVGNYGMLQFLWKTEVYGLAGYMADGYRKAGDSEKADALQVCIDALPTDGLGITESDFDQIGVRDYGDADRLLIDYLNGSTDNRDHPVIQRHLKSAFKRVDPQNISREVLFQ